MYVLLFIFVVTIVFVKNNSYTVKLAFLVCSSVSFDQCIEQPVPYPINTQTTYIVLVPQTTGAMPF